MSLSSRLGSCAVRSFNRRSLCTKVSENLKASSNNVASTVVNKKPSRKFRIFLALNTVPAVAFYGYYKFALNEQEKRRVRVNVKSVYRAVRSFAVGFQIAMDYKWNLWRLDEDSVEYDTAIKGCHTRSAGRMADACIANGGLYVKLGQGLSTMNQVLPEEFYMPLRRLQNEALRTEGTEIDELFLEEFNKKPKELFEEFDYKPLAAASLAQVHKARGHDGQEYAVKLQYIDLQDRFQGDIFTCQSILKIIAWSFPSFSFSWILDELKGTLEKELDFLNEGKNGERCYKELKHLKYVYVPKIFWEKSSKRILTMEFINGVKISDLDGIKRLGLNLKDIDTKLVNAFAEQVFHSGFVHADPHHANVFVRRLGNTNEAEIVLLDHGLYEYINDEDRKNLCKLWKSIILKDEEKMKFFSTKLNVKEENFMAFAAFLMMRPLHRPVHEKFVFAEVWDKMSELEKEQANREGKLRIPRTREEFKKMKQSEIVELTQKAKPFIEDIKKSVNELLNQIPKSMFLICRNLNTIRSVVHDHGNIVDRHTLMARSAISGAYKEELKTNVAHRFRAWFELRYFDLILFYDRFTRYIGSIYMNYLLKNNQLSKEILNEINKSMEKI